jgi:NADH-quinone oxidoreductase subunit M
MIFIGLSLFIIPLCLLASIPIMKTMETPYLIIYIVCIFSLEYFIIGAFAATNFFLFFVFFEATLIPMIILIGI